MNVMIFRTFTKLIYTTTTKNVNYGVFSANRRAICLASARQFSAKRDDINKMMQTMSNEDAKSGGDDDESAEDDAKPSKYRGKTQDYKQKIYLKDVSGRMLGLKTRQEAQQIAAKNRLILLEDDLTKKIPTLRLADPHDLQHEDRRAVSGDAKRSDSPKHNRAIIKQMFFNAKLSDHDLQVKIRLVWRWLAKGHETMIKVNSFGSSGDSTKLKMIDKEFDRIFNRSAGTTGTKINQRRLTESELKFNVVPIDHDLIAAASVDAHRDDNSSISHHNQHHEANKFPDLDQIDPNQLLNDTENILKNIDDAGNKGDGKQQKQKQ